MINNLGYEKKLFILPFDHRSSFAKLFGFQALTPEEKNYIISAKKIIYEAFQKAISQDVPKDQAAILIDEEYGSEILKDATKKNITTLLTTEKSGGEGFEFEYGNGFAKHIEKYNPTFVKALIRYEPDVDWSNLKKLSDYCHDNGCKFLLEVLMGLDVVTAKDLLPAIDDLREKGMEPDVWKLEGMENKNDYESVITKIKEEKRQNVGLVILGRGESKGKVKQWITAGRDTEGIIGFAIGRTIFSQPLKDFQNNKLNKDETIEKISNNFQYFYKLFGKRI